MKTHKSDLQPHALTLFHSTVKDSVQYGTQVGKFKGIPPWPEFLPLNAKSFLGAF